jgi:phenylpropionate dioxygenase-like ring-hydroxylating dioxygenase large terminal subunit
VNAVVDTHAQTIDTGTGYGRARPQYDRRLAEVGPGTPTGELLRRYWHPVALTADACDRPARVRVLGEDLILFRDGAGHPGLVLEHCTHRGSSLYYGRVEAEGIRCCYHGWLFARDGRCLDKAVEPDGGTPRAIDRQPWYPVQERFGLIFAYLGPPDRKPVLPRYDVLEDLEPNECFAADDNS